MTLTQLQQNLHALIENDSDTPESTDDTYTVRTRLINQAILQWENERDVLWKELWATESGNDTVTASDTDYDAPANFKMPGGYVWFTDADGNVTKLPIVDVEDVQTYDGDEKICYFTGNPQDGYVLNLGWSPTASDQLTGQAISYDYYKTADQLSSASDTAEMSDPSFIVFWVAAHQSQVEGDFNSYTVFFQQAQEALRRMRVANETGTNHQNMNLEDEEWIQDSVAMGL